MLSDKQQCIILQKEIAELKAEHHTTKIILQFSMDILKRAMRFCSEVESIQTDYLMFISDLRKLRK